MDSAISRRRAQPGPVTRAAGDPHLTERVPRRATLDGFTEEVEVAEGLNLHAAEPLVPILVTTRNSLYRIIPLRRGDADVMIQGGRFFPEPAEARLVGSTFGGSVLQTHWIRVGMCMEIDRGSDEGPIVTTRVLNVEIERDQTTNRRLH